MDQQTTPSTGPSLRFPASSGKSLIDQHIDKALATLKRKFQDLQDAISAREACAKINITTRIGIVEAHLASLQQFQYLAEASSASARLYRHTERNCRDEVACLTAGIVMRAPRFEDAAFNIERIKRMEERCPTTTPVMDCDDGSSIYGPGDEELACLIEGIVKRAPPFKDEEIDIEMLEAVEKHCPTAPAKSDNESSYYGSDDEADDETTSSDDASTLPSSINAEDWMDELVLSESGQHEKSAVVPATEGLLGELGAPSPD